MPKKKDDKQDKQENKSEWIPVYKKRLGEAILYAKGDMSMAQFAKKCGLNPMTLWRAVKGEIEKPLKEETIKIMAEKSDNPTDDVFEYLMHTNGYVKNDDEKRQQEFEQRRQERKDRHDLAQGIIMRTLFDNGYTIIPVMHTELEKLDPTLKKSRFRLGTNVKFALRIHGFEPAYWNFSVNIFTGKEYAADKDMYKSKLLDEMIFMNARYNDVFLRDAWEPEAFEKCQYSIVFLNKDLFDSFSDYLDGVQFTSTFSLILLDIDKQIVVEERFLPRRDGREQTSLFGSLNRGD